MCRGIILRMPLLVLPSATIRRQRQGDLVDYRRGRLIAKVKSVSASPLTVKRLTVSSRIMCLLLNRAHLSAAMIGEVVRPLSIIL